MSSDRKWGFRHLLAGWGAYWSVLAVTTLATPVRYIWQVTHQPNDTGNVSASFANDVLHASISSYGKTVWTGSASFLSLIFWITAPPLLMWFVWLITRSRASTDAAPAAVKSETDAAQLRASSPSFASPGDARDRQAARASQSEHRQP